jgi:pyruvate dehydrogenase E2 component (dihydrolipoamide acetyltransferase)
MEEGSVSRWLLSEGDAVNPGDVLAEIETDKATVGMEATEEGYLAKILVPAGSHNVSVGTPVAVLCEDSESVPQFADYSASASASPESAPASDSPSEHSSAPSGPAAAEAQPEPAAAPASDTPQSKTDRIFASPAARKHAREAGVDLNRISGTGPHGRILLADVQEAKEEAGVAPAAAGAEYTDVPVNTIRRITATRLQESKQSVPHFYSSIDCVMDRLLAVRAEMNAHFTSAKLSVNDFVMKAAARALHEVPEVNSKWVDNTTIRRLHRANLGVAVQTDSGLMVPVVENVGTKSIYSVNADVSSSAKKAKDMKLQPSEMEGGTFTVSNLGMFGVKDFCAIVNPPQAGILAVGATRQEVVPSSQSASGVATQNVMTVTLSADHRVVDGAVGAQWLSAFKGAVEAPASLVAEGG